MEAKLLLIRWLVGFVCWLVSILYSSIPLLWFAIHPFAGRWRKVRRSPYSLLLPKKRFGQNFHNYKRSVPLIPGPLFSYHARRKPV